MFSFCHRVLRNRMMAEDVLQQVFLEAHRDLDRFARVARALPLLTRRLESKGWTDE